jgi:hypothetical protein
MDNIFTIAIITTVCFCFFKFIEMRFLEKDGKMKPLKYFARDVMIVFVSVSIAVFAYSHLFHTVNDLMNTITETKVLNPGLTEVFTDTPGF